MRKTSKVKIEVTLTCDYSSQKAKEEMLQTIEREFSTIKNERHSSAGYHWKISGAKLLEAKQ